jgi:apolipoprotein N-acyltransferase
MNASAATKSLPELQIRPDRRPPQAWPWLAAGFVLLLVSYGANNIPIAAWFSPVFLLRFARRNKWHTWAPALYLTAAAGIAFQLRGMVPIPGIGYYLFLAISALEFLVPYAADRWLHPKLGGMAGTLVFPTAFAGLDYLNSLGPYGSWGALAYSQYGNLALLQLLSITGLWGIAFLIAWFAAVCNALWEDGWNSPRARKWAYLCFGSIGVVILLGGVRLAFFPPHADTVRIASLSKRSLASSLSEAISARLMQNKPTPEDLIAIRKWGEDIDNDLLTRVEREAQAGAKIVFWGEANAPVFKQDEHALVQRGSELARNQGIYLGMALAVLNTGKNPPLENKLVLIQPDGSITWEYNKVHPVPGAEAAMQIRGDGKLKVSDTSFGRISAVICFDADFPQLLSQAGALHTDIVLDPSNDWRAIDPWHTQMASFRAIEQGVNLVRQTSNGLSAAYDYEGRRLSAMDHYQTSNFDLVSEVPIHGVRTIYSRFGDWFAWVCLAALSALAVRSLRTNLSSRAEHDKR